MRTGVINPGSQFVIQIQWRKDKDTEDNDRNNTIFARVSRWRRRCLFCSCDRFVPSRGHVRCKSSSQSRLVGTILWYFDARDFARFSRCRGGGQVRNCLQLPFCCRVAAHPRVGVERRPPQTRLSSVKIRVKGNFFSLFLC